MQKRNKKVVFHKIKIATRKFNYGLTIVLDIRRFLIFATFTAFFCNKQIIIIYKEKILIYNNVL